MYELQPQPEQPPQGDRPEPTGGRAYPYASWGPLSGLGIAILALFFGLLASIPFLALDSRGPSDLSLETTVTVQIATALGFVLVPIAAAAAMSGNPARGLRELGFVGFKVKPAVLWSVAGILGYMAFALVYITAFGTPQQDDIAGKFGPAGIQILLIVIVAPLAEEICFRGLLFRGFRTRFPFWFSALLAASVFGLLHYSTGVSAIPLLIGLGFVFALVYEKTESIWPAIILHAANNGLALIALSAA